ncbi:MAG: DUF2393 family protein [Campylobacterales bacterium]
MEKVKELISSFKEFFVTVSVYDFAFMGGFFLLFLLFFLLAILFRKNIALFILFFLMSLSTIGVAPFVVNSLIDNYVNKFEVVYKNNRELNFFDGILISGTLINKGRVDFKRCVFEVILFMPASNVIKESANKLKPLLKREFVLEGPIKKGESKDFRYLIEGINFENYEKEVDIRCF